MGGCGDGRVWRWEGVEMGGVEVRGCRWEGVEVGGCGGGRVWRCVCGGGRMWRWGV